MKKGVLFVVAALSLVIAFALAGKYYKEQKTESTKSAAQANADLFNRAYSPSLGSPDAKVVITKFLDPGCETCRAFHPFVKGAVDAFPGKIKLVIRYAPLHHGADYMVKVLEAARLQGKYWETLQVMYDTQHAWASHSNPQPQLIWQYLPKVGLNLEQLKKDVDSSEIDRILQQDIADANTLGINKTPGFFVNGRPLVAFGAEPLKQLILSELNNQYPDTVQ
jgi:protein-disulfide isomerase